MAENVALRYRLKNTVDTMIPPGISTLPPEPRNYGNWLRDNWGRLAAIAGLILLLAYCSHKDSNPDTTLAPPGTGDAATPQASANYCQKCSTGSLSTINIKRTSDVNSRIVLDEKRREDISKRWMKNLEWNNAIQLFQSNRALVEGNSPQTSSVATSLDAVLKKPTVQNVQELQRCIGMTEQDNKTAQDGIL